MSSPDDTIQVPQYNPFFDPIRNGKQLSWFARFGIAIGLGAIYSLLQLLTLQDKAVYLGQYCWVLSIIIASSLAALYVATFVFRQSLQVLVKFEAGTGTTQQVISNVLTDRSFLITSLVFATATTAVTHIIGVPVDLHVSSLALIVSYLGYFTAGFCSGLGLWAIFGVISLYLRFAPNLQYSLDPKNPDGNGGIKLLGESLWFFALLIAVIGLLIAGYMFSVDWTNLQSSLARALFLIWLALPFTCAISVVMIPGMAVRRQVDQFRERRLVELKRERASVHAAFKEFDPEGDDEIISGKRELNDRLREIQREMDGLENMRTSPLDGPRSR